MLFDRLGFVLRTAAALSSLITFVSPNAFAADPVHMVTMTASNRDLEDLAHHVVTALRSHDRISAVFVSRWAAHRTLNVSFSVRDGSIDLPAVRDALEQADVTATLRDLRRVPDGFGLSGFWTVESQQKTRTHVSVRRSPGASATSPERALGAIVRLTGAQGGALDLAKCNRGEPIPGTATIRVPSAGTRAITDDDVKRALDGTGYTLVRIIEQGDRS